MFKDDEDRHGFVRALGEACEKTGWQVHAYCLEFGDVDGLAHGYGGSYPPKVGLKCRRPWGSDEARAAKSRVSRAQGNGIESGTGAPPAWGAAEHR